MTVPQELCHQPEVNRFLNITSPLPPGPVSLYVFANSLSSHERAWLKISSAKLALVSNFFFLLCLFSKSAESCSQWCLNEGSHFKRMTDVLVIAVLCLSGLFKHM